MTFWNAIRLNAFGNALGNATLAGIERENAISERRSNNVDPVAAAELQEEIKQEIISGYKPPAYAPVTLPDAVLGTGSNIAGLTPDELARLATTTQYSGTYVDPYLIARNGGDAGWTYAVQTFWAIDDTQTTIAELPRTFVPTPTETYAGNSDEAVQNLGLRIVGSGIGIGKAAYQAASGAVGLLGSWVGTGFDDVLGQSGLGWTNYFHADTAAFQHAVDSTAQFLGNHPIATALNAWGTALNRAAELSVSNNPKDQLKSGDILGQLSFNTVVAADGAAGLGQMGLSGASLVADGAGDLVSAMSQVRFAGSADSYVGFSPQIGAVGDLSGFRPNIGGSLDVGDASPVQPLGSPQSVTMPQSVGSLRAAGLKDAHHVIQDAAVRDLLGYDTNAAPGIQLPGPSTLKGTPHYNATQVQRGAGGGTYGAERVIAYKALRAAGYSDAEAAQAIQEADKYFNSIGVNENTPTRIPGNRW